nr:outer membrane beta-barrel protein [uncultured Porphyromonas sp.]
MSTHHVRPLLLILLALCLYVTPSLGQRVFRLRVLSPIEQPVASASVRVECCRDTIYLGKTDPTGIFTADVPAGCDSLHLWVLAEGYGQQEHTVTLQQGLQYTLRLTEVELGQVEIIASRSSVKTDAEGTTYRISMQGLPPKAKAALALKRLPGVITRMEEFSLIGARGSATIYVDEVPVDSKLLSTLEAADIDRVEVRYLDHNSSGEGGAIYIYRKKAERPVLKGDLELSGGLLYPSWTLTPSLTLYSRAVDIIANASATYSHQHPEFHVYRNDRPELSISNRAKALQSGAQLFATTELTPRLRGTLTYAHLGIQSWLKSHVNQQGVVTSGRIRENQMSHAVNLLLAYKLGSNNRLLLKSYGLWMLGNDTDLRGMADRVNSRDALAEIAYEHNEASLLGLTHRLGVGFGGRLGRNNLYDGLAPYRNRQLRAYVRDNVSLLEDLSLYFILTGQWGEYGRDRLYSYSTFTPSLSLSYELGGYTIGLRYGHSVQHPSADLLSPRVFYRNELEQRQGNPHLGPQYTDNWALSLSKQFGRHSLSLKSTYWHASDLISSLYTNQPNVLTYGNAGIGDMLSTTLNYSTALLSNQLSLNLYVGATYADYRLAPSYRARALTYGTRGWSLEWGGSVNYYHPKGWLASLDLSADGLSRSLSHQQEREPLLMLLLQKSFFAGKLDVNLNMMAPFGWGERMTETTFLRGIVQRKETRTSLSLMCL